MTILFEQIEGPALVDKDQFDDIQGLTLTLPPATVTSTHALLILNVPMPYAEGPNFPGITFALNVREAIVASGGFTYSDQAPASFARHPFTLVTRVSLQPQQSTLVRAQWASVRGSKGRIDSFASISAILGRET